MKTTLGLCTLIALTILVYSANPPRPSSPIQQPLRAGLTNVGLEPIDLAGDLEMGALLYFGKGSTPSGKLLDRNDSHLFPDNTRGSAVLVRWKPGIEEWLPTKAIAHMWMQKPGKKC